MAACSSPPTCQRRSTQRTPLPGFQSRCLYHVPTSSSTTTVSFALGRAGAAVGSACSVFSWGAVLLGGVEHKRLWKRQSSFWHWPEQYETCLHLPQRRGLAQGF
eukprot:CAMPEP_0115259082 /NCGR_PEP_ID=MMETSP0270-20121206/47638_1 /TAXON_ID=71861 /ORGANISM="Scrippsiella trochoidea, Strain CCMP3099" /LENGTH=103 /DNA_ID=CAMNT_0002674875 /DNA_START=76 /DNA_END=387 /DNA_ORIENTATION=+